MDNAIFWPLGSIPVYACQMRTPVYKDCGRLPAVNLTFTSVEQMGMQKERGHDPLFSLF